MASILTNATAMTALQTLKQVSSDLGVTQERISTGKRVNTARENAAYWSVATVMGADVAGFKAVTDSLELGAGTTNTASVATKNIIENLNTMKARIIAGETNGVDKQLIQNDIDQLTKLVSSAAADASFNGENLLKVHYAGDGTAQDKDVEILCSTTRSGGTTLPSYINLDRQDLQVRSIIGKATIEQQVNATNPQKASLGFDVGDPSHPFIQGQNLGLGTMTFSFTTESVQSPSGVTIEPQQVSVSIDLSDIAYDTDRANTQTKISDRINYYAADAIFQAESTAMTAAGAGADIPTVLGAAPVVGNAGVGDTTMPSSGGYTPPTIPATPLGQMVPTMAFAAAPNLGTLRMTVGSGYTDAASYTSQVRDVWVTSKPSAAFGGLADLTQIDVANNPTVSLTKIDQMIAQAIASASEIGAVESRIDTQKDFVSKLTSAMQVGVGSLVDADMNEESTRLQALQVQQQLATQALTIANQSTQSLTSLFKN